MPIVSPEKVTKKSTNSKTTIKTNKEIWKPLKGYEKIYKISSLGRIKIIKTGKFKKPYHTKSGYDQVSLTKNKVDKKPFVHRLVAYTFGKLKSLDSKLHVDHINRIRDDNRLDNLRVATCKENNSNKNICTSRYRAIYGINLDGNKITRYESIEEAKRKHKLSSGSSISQCCLGQRKFASGYVWFYAKIRIQDMPQDNEKFINLGKVDDYDFSNYEISTHGNIRKIDSDYFSKSNDINGYDSFTLVDIDGKKGDYLAHRLVAMKFVKGRTCERNIVNQINENKKDNYYKNLQWCTSQENGSHSLGKQIKQIDPKTNEVICTYSSGREAERKCENIDRHRLSEACDGKLKLYKDYYWRWVDENDTKPDKEKIKLNKEVKQIDPITRKVIKIFDSTMHIERHFGCYMRGKIREACNGKLKLYKNFYWRWVDDANNEPDETDETEETKNINVKQINPKTMKVVGVFGSITEAGRQFGQEHVRKQISKALDTDKLVKGFLWVTA